MLFLRKKNKNAKAVNEDVNNVKAHDFDSLMGQVRDSSHQLKAVQQAFNHLKKTYNSSETNDKK